MDTTADRIAHARPEWLSWSLLVLGVASASVSAILIRYAGGAHPLAISFWRCFAGAALLVPFARWRRRGMDRRHLRLSVVAGFFLALHFATWIWSVDLTTVAESVLLVSTTPVFVALVAWILFKERLPLAGWVGIALAVGGAALVGLSGGGSGGRSSLLGNFLALAGAITVGGYAIAGGLARKCLGIIEYAVVAYATAAVFLLVAALVAGADLGGYPSATWWAIVGLIVGPQLLGHTVINLVLRDIDVTTVSVTIMAEPVIATALAFALFSEVPSIVAVPGGAAILIGIYVVSVIRRSPGQVVVE